MCRLPVKHLSKVQNRPYLGTSRCLGINVLQAPALFKISDSVQHDNLSGAWYAFHTTAKRE